MMSEPSSFPQMLLPKGVGRMRCVCGSTKFEVYTGTEEKAGRLRLYGLACCSCRRADVFDAQGT
jgi:hypothetical protein